MVQVQCHEVKVSNPLTRPPAPARCCPPAALRGEQPKRGLPQLLRLHSLATMRWRRTGGLGNHLNLARRAARIVSIFLPSLVDGDRKMPFDAGIDRL